MPEELKCKRGLAVPPLPKITVVDEVPFFLPIGLLVTKYGRVTVHEDTSKATNAKTTNKL
jgi:hypothetical protein